MMQSNRDKFKTELLDNSVSKEYEEAVLEWIPIGVSMDDSFCICGHTIVENCHIKNTINNIELIVGNVCINKFLPNLTGEKDHMMDILKVKTNKKVSMREDTILYLKCVNIISDWHYSFLKSILGKRNLSSKQSKLKDDIYQIVYDRIVKIKNPDIQDEVEKKIRMILGWSEYNTWYDITFISSVYSFYKRNHTITPKQEEAIDRLIEKLKIEV